MGPVPHTLISVLAGTVFYTQTDSIGGSIACLVAGVLIDGDHLLDYYVAKKRVTCRLFELHAFCGQEKKGRLMLLLHSYELLAVLWLSIFMCRLNMVWVGMALGMTLHILTDHLTNPIRPLVYFIFYRLKHRFNRQWIFTEDYYCKLR